MFMSYKTWKSQKYLLDKMSLNDLVKAYFTYPGIQVYLMLFFALCILAVYSLGRLADLAIVVVVVILVYPLVWYVLHRFLLHGRWLYKSEMTAALWKRIHFDHHQNPNDMAVLFGGLHTTLPTVVVVTAPMGGLIGGLSGAAIGLATGILVTCFYEFCHCSQHLGYAPKSAFLERIKQLHMAHHFHNETGNYGITNYLWDRFFSSYYDSNSSVPRSPTARNLGYTDSEAKRYPWVAQLSTGSETAPIVAAKN